MKKFNKITLVFLLMLFSICTFAQEPSFTTTSGVMRSNGRIYVVMAVILAIFLGLILYLVRLERKINKLEKENHLAK